MIKIVDNYTLTDYLGKGEYGKVYKASNIETKMDVAVKMIPVSKFEEVSRLAELTRNELEILKILENNIHVIKFVEMIKTSRHIYLVYEFCEGGTLEDVIRSRGHIPEKEAMRMFKQLVSAFKSLHEHHVLHRDVKPDNIFFKSGHLKLADFGFCKKLKHFDDLSQTSLGSPLYMAPEVLNGDVYDSRADVWSAGVVLYEMLFGRCPFGECNIKQLINMYSNEKLRIPMSVDDIYISPTAENMLRRMLEKDQLKRISWEDFFYEYEIDEYGNIKKKEKDFEYDLMKLMKKNSSLGQQQAKAKNTSSLKFDWSKITDGNSSVHSEELNVENRIDNENIDEIFNFKKRVKEFESEYEKRLELSGIIEEMLSSTNEIYYSSSLTYFLVYNLQNIISSTLPELQNFLIHNKELLFNYPHESNLLNKMVVVCRNEAETLNSKLNFIKMSILTSSDFSKSCLKFPEQSVLTRETTKFIKSFEEKTKGITDIVYMSSTPEKRIEQIYLIKVLWGVSLAKKQAKPKDIQSISIKTETTNKEISKILNKLIVYINS